MQAQRREWPAFGIGDTVEVYYKIKEGDKQRVQLYSGNVISIRGAGMGKSFIVRRISHEIGVERIFPWHSPMIEKIVVTRYGKVRRAKLYYLREKSGKEGRIKEAVKFDAESEARKAAKSKKKRATKKAAKKVAKKAAVKQTAKKTASKKKKTAARK
ncbi:MAG: 50S ribosomal protein L19 [Leptospiraceae bacterium]|nr:50S ribosomal protein L19 [Leptospiraceae bacterium]